MKPQRQQGGVSTAAEVSATGLTQKTIMPKVRYHPTIHIQQPGDGGAAKTRTSQTQKAKPAAAAAHPPEAGETHADKAHNDTSTSQINPEPAVRPVPVRGNQQKYRNHKPAGKPTEKLDSKVPGTVKNQPQSVESSADLDVMLGTDDVKEVERNTRGQRINPDWFAWRKNRITASLAHNIAHCEFISGKSKTPPASYLVAITGKPHGKPNCGQVEGVGQSNEAIFDSTGKRPNIQTRAMSWGVEMEAEAARRYQVLKSKALGHAVKVQECGLFIDSKRSWLAASPDGIVTDTKTGQRLLCLEVKCPYKHRDRTVEEACRDDRNFCLVIQAESQRAGESPVYRLKQGHQYYTQIQCQLATTGLEQADLVVFTRKETAIVPVPFDPGMWEETVSRLERFYRDALLPYLRENGRVEAGAAWAPEQ
ncbi:uncharacterized protein LOC142988106 isoform X2 [Genypterus blacodes]